MKLKKIKFVYFINIIICLAFFNVSSVSQVPWLDLLVNVVRLLVFFVLAFEWIYRRKFQKYQIAVLLLFAARLISTAIYGDSVATVISLFFPIITTMLLLERNLNNLPMLIKSLYVASGLLIIANTIALILFPNGLYTANYGHTLYWIIGQKQDWNIAYIAFFICSIIFWNEKKIKKITIIVYAAILYSFTVQTPLGLIIYFVVSIGLMFLSKKRKILKAKVMFIINACAEVVLIIIAYNFKRIIWLNTLLYGISAGDVLTKQDTFLIRVNMWIDGLRQFITHPLLGVGYVSSDRWNSIYSLTTYHPNMHNTPIDIMATSGMIGLISFIMIYVYSAKKLDLSRSRHSVLLTYSIFGINVLMLTEGVYAPFVWFFIFLGIHISKLDQEISSSIYSMADKKKK